ncbi:hypothetical protein K501DRAFT_329139 [Backusella circina FSU 941]|nr:hypothetical protein K501DRAFT_329139 [Backusella circina FSU 941]
MDINQILSLLNEQKNKTSTPPAPTVPVIPTFPEGLNLSSFDPNIINQVRQEYLAKKEHISPPTTSSPTTSFPTNTLDDLLDSLKHATTVTPDVLTAISRMVKETQLLNVLRKCKTRQDKKERELFDHRESIKARHQKQKDAIFAKELIGVSDPNAIKLLERESAQELKRMDIQILKDMDKESRLLQEELTKLKVPLFKVTHQPQELQTQQKVLTILVDMM